MGHGKLMANCQITIFDGFLSHSGTPSHHPSLKMFSYKPTSYWGYIHDYGTPHP